MELFEVLRPNVQTTKKSTDILLVFMFFIYFGCLAYIDRNSFDWGDYGI